MSDAMTMLRGLVKRIWTEVTLTWTRPVGAVALLAVLVLSAAWPAFSDASVLVIIGLVVWLAPRDARLAREAHLRRGTPWPSKRSLNIRGGIFLALMLACLYGGDLALESKNSSGTEALFSLAGVFAALAWLHLVSLKKPPEQPSGEPELADP